MAGATMTKKTEARGRGRPPGKVRETRVVFARIGPELAAALDAFVEQSRPRTTATAVVEAALEDFLHRAGMWPPQATK